MGEVQVQIYQEQPFIAANSPKPTPTPTMHTQQQQQPTELLQLRESVEPIDLSTLHLNAAAGCHHHHHPSPSCTATCNGSFGSNSLKRRSPPTSSANGAGERSAKKLFCDQEDLALRGFSAVSLPMSLGAVTGGSRPRCPVLRRCVSDPYKPPAPAVESPEDFAGGGGNPGTPPPARGSGLPPLPPSLRRSVSDVTPSPTKVLSRSLSSEETTPDSSVRLRRMKDRLREMKQWCDEALKDEEEEQEQQQQQIQAQEELVECAAAEDDKVPPQDDLGGDSEEAVSVEWAEKCLSLTFRCPCGKGYEVLLSANNCYYKLV